MSVESTPIITGWPLSSSTMSGAANTVGQDVNDVDFLALEHVGQFSIIGERTPAADASGFIEFL